MHTGVTDTFGRQLVLAYDSEKRLSTLQAGGGIYTYSYNVKPAADSPPVPVGGWVGVTKNWSVLATVTRPDGKSRTYHYEHASWLYALTGITDERGVRFATFGYDDEGRPISSEHAGGVDRYTFTYDPVGGKVTATNALSKRTVYNYTDDAQDNRLLTSVTGEPSPNCPLTNSTLTYDANNFLASIVDAESRRTEYTNDASGLPTVVKRAVGTPTEESTAYTWHPEHRLPTRILSPGLATDLAYDTSGNLVERSERDTTTHTVPYSTNGLTRTWTYTYATGGLLDTADGPLPGIGDRVDYDYDGAGALDKVTDELGHVTDIVGVNGRGQPIAITDPNGKDFSLAYDGIGRLISVTADLGWAQRVTAIEYDAVGQVTKVTLPI